MSSTREDALPANIDRAGAVLTANRLQAELLSQGARRKDAAAAVRERVFGGNLTTEQLESAATEVIASEAMAATFDRVAETRSRYSSLRPPP